MRIITFFQLLRPHQWLKNLMLLFPPFLGGIILQEGMLERAIIPLLAFCLASSSTYVFNDLFDAESDSHHPRKKFRPIAAGEISRPVAFFIGAGLLLVSVFLALMVSTTFTLIVASYLVLTLAYSAKLKEIAIVDIFCIAAGFLLRLEAGGAAFGVKISDWLFLSVFLLSIFLSTGKRIAESRDLTDTAGHHRSSLLEYPKGFLEGTLYMTGSTVLVTYAMYVIKRPMLVYTIPLCTFGLLRFMMLVKSTKYDDPTESLLRDAPLFLVGLMWTGLVGYATYFVH
jgi:4-hydroxybenzoate polyprenyltransferase